MMKQSIDINKLVFDYAITQSSVKASAMNNISTSTGYRLLKKAGVINKEINTTCNNNFFHNNSPQAFYWAGFIADDENLFIKKGKNKQLCIKLSCVDDGHLKKLKKAIGFSGKIKYNIKKHSCSITIKSNVVLDDLKMFNITANKKLLYDLPEWLLKHNLLSHFLRGLLDRGGHFYNQNRKDEAAFDFVGTKNVVSFVKKILSQYCKLNDSKICKVRGSETYSIRRVGNDCVSEIIKFVYNNSDEENRLNRKYNKVARNSQYVLGLDLSLNSTGFCVLGGDGKIISDGYGTIEAKSGGLEGKKLSRIEKAIKSIIRKYKPSTVIIENIFRGKNINTFRSLSMVRGIMYKIAYEEGIEDDLYCISASQVRKIIGCGKSKEEAFIYINKQYKEFDFNFDEHNDIIDSIGLALAYNEMQRQGLTEADLKTKKNRKRKKRR